MDYDDCRIPRSDPAHPRYDEDRRREERDETEEYEPDVMYEHRVAERNDDGDGIS